MLAWFTQAIHPEVRPLRNELETYLVDLIARRRQKVSMMTAEKNRRNTTHGPVNQRLEEHITWLESELGLVEQHINRFIHRSPVWQEKEVLMQSIIGVGLVTAATLLAELPERGTLNLQKIAAKPVWPYLIETVV